MDLWETNTRLAVRGVGVHEMTALPQQLQEYCLLCQRFVLLTQMASVAAPGAIPSEGGVWVTWGQP